MEERKEKDARMWGMFCHLSALVAYIGVPFGHLLGPLVVSAVGLEVPEGLLRADLWEVLSKAVSAQKRGLAGRLLIADSKKAYNRKKGIDGLRRSVLAGLGAWQNTQPETMADVLGLLCPQLLDRVGLYPWYQTLDTHRLGHDAADISIAGGVLGKTMAEHGISIHSIQSRCLDVAFYNDRVGKVKNKSRVLFTELCALIGQAFEQNTGGTEPMPFTRMRKEEASLRTNMWTVWSGICQAPCSKSSLVRMLFQSHSTK